MRITDLDPLEHGLLFERFLNPDRVSMPDFDIDFDERRRGEVIRYVTDKYGDDRVSMIVTYGTIKAKQAVKDSSPDPRLPVRDGRPDHQGDAGRGDGQGRPAQGDLRPRAQALRRGRRVPGLYDADPDVKQVVDTAIGIEGLKRQWGVHAAGVIMSSEPLLDVIPLLRRPADGAMITQFDYPTCETLGPDQDGLPGAAQPHGPRRRAASTSRPTAARRWCSRTSTSTTRRPTSCSARGDTLGVFQLDGGPMRALLRSMRPDSFEDISAVGALYRPGPMGADSHNKYARRKTGREPVEPIHPELAEPLEEILGETYGLIVYQEQVHGDRPEARRLHPRPGRPAAPAMGKKKKEIWTPSSSPSPTGMTEQRLLRRARSRRCGTSCCRSPTTPSTRPTPRPTAWSPTGPPTSRPTTRPSTWPRC